MISSEPQLVGTIQQVEIEVRTVKTKDASAWIPHAMADVKVNGVELKTTVGALVSLIDNIVHNLDEQTEF